MSFFNISQSDLESVQKIVFMAKEVVEFVILDYSENAQNGSLILNTKVLTGEHVGRNFTLFIENRDHEISKRNRIQFALAFWTAEELKSGSVNPAKLVNRKFSAQALASREHNGQVYQNFSGWKDLGPHTEGTGTEEFVDGDGKPRF